MDTYMIIIVLSCICALLLTGYIVRGVRSFIEHNRKKKEWESKMAEIALTRKERFKDIMRQTAEVGNDA